ncbi:MAG: protein kinase [Myxococcaceae bacterium]|nr:protein kinase [Myxococcaceae bacterium]
MNTVEPIWFGRYRLTSRIATGGMAEVYLGRHIDEAGNFGPMVAVKRLLPHLVKDPQIVRMFLNEARITAQITHPNVVRILDLGQEGTEPFIAMELLEGRTFADVRQKAADDGRRVPLGITLRILTDACRGLDAAHRAVDEEGNPISLVHRDFTPDNIHVGVSGEVKVIDFGIAKTNSWGSGTEPGTLKGKFFYMSPEMILAKPVDHRADLFAAGVMLYEQLCGHRPFTGLSIDEVVMRIAEGGHKPPRTFDPSVPEALEAVCMTALQKDPDQRFPSLQEFNTALEAIGGPAQLSTPEEVGAYVAALFPAEKDARRQTIKRARLMDPSHPGTPAAGAVAVGMTPPAGSGPLTPSKEESPSAQVEPAAAPASSNRWILVAIPVVMTVLGVVGGYWYKNRAPDMTPDALLTAAVAAKPSERAAALEPLLAHSAATAEHFERASKLLIESNAWDLALKASEAWQKKSPQDARAFILEGRAAAQLRKGKRAEAALEKAAALAPADVEVDLALAQLRELQGDAAGALAAYDNALKKKPTSVDLKAKRGFWLSQAGRLDEAAALLSGVLATRFDAISAAELAFVKQRQGQLGPAVDLLKKAIKADPTLMSAHYYLGAIQHAQGDIKGARASYLEADRLAPTDPRAVTALCQMDSQQKAPELAETRKKIQQRFPEQATSLLNSCP